MSRVIPAAANDDIAFLVIGDWGSGNSAQQAVAHQMGLVAHSTGARFVISTGDNFYPKGVRSESDALWQERYEKVYDAPSLQIPWYPVLGNHDHQGNVAAQIAYSKRSQRWRMPATQYVSSEKLGVTASVDFFFIDTDPIRRQYRSWTGRLRRNAQIAWLDQQLARSRASWKIVVGHHPIFSAERRKNARALVTHLKPVLERHRVQAYVHGHSHTLAHIEAKGVHYLTSGAGALPRRADSIVDAKFARGDQLGFLAVRLSPGSMVVEFWSADGEALYRASIKAKYE